MTKNITATIPNVDKYYKLSTFRSKLIESMKNRQNITAADYLDSDRLKSLIMPSSIISPTAIRYQWYAITTDKQVKMTAISTNCPVLLPHTRKVRPTKDDVIPLLGDEELSTIARSRA